ncbi:MAG: sortase [Bacilli bacterium]
MKKNQVKNLLLISFILIVIIGVVFIFYLLSSKKATFKPFTIVSKTEQIASTVIEDTPAVGWIRVQGTNIDYPIIYETPNAYNSGLDYTWISHTPEGEENRMAIYGHNIQNVSAKPLTNDQNQKRFEQLMSFVYKDFAKNNLYIQYSHNGIDELYKIYAVSFFDKDEDRGKVTKTKIETDNYIKGAKEKSLYKYAVEVDSNDKIISLITCTRYFGDKSKTQFKVDARLVRSNEKPDEYTVQTTSNYDIIKEK